MHDYELLYYIHQGLEEAMTILVKKYEPMVQAIARRIHQRYHHTSVSYEDLVQAGLYALFQAIHEYCDDRNRSFQGYLYMCIECEIKSAVRFYFSNKQKSVTLSLSMNHEIGYNQGITYEDVFQDERIDRQPKKQLYIKESLSEFTYLCKNNLSPLEQKVLALKLDGLDYVEIAKCLNKNYKAIDNALSRIKKKLRPHEKKLTTHHECDTLYKNS